jgi:hypothetical protein
MVRRMCVGLYHEGSHSTKFTELLSFSRNSSRPIGYITEYRDQVLVSRSWQADPN